MSELTDIEKMAVHMAIEVADPNVRKLRDDIFNRKGEDRKIAINDLYDQLAMAKDEGGSSYYRIMAKYRSFARYRVKKVIFNSL